MKRNVFALVVYERPEPCESLKPVLRALGVDAFSVSSCDEAAHLLEQTHPHLVFSDTQLPDGSWLDLVNIVEDAALPTCVILVGASKDQGMFQASIRDGAFGFVSPPFEDEAVSRLVSRAMTLVRARREHHSRAAVA